MSAVVQGHSPCASQQLVSRNGDRPPPSTLSDSPPVLGAASSSCCMQTWTGPPMFRKGEELQRRDGIRDSRDQPRGTNRRESALLMGWQVTPRNSSGDQVMIIVLGGDISALPDVTERKLARWHRDQVPNGWPARWRATPRWTVSYTRERLSSTQAAVPRGLTLTRDTFFVHGMGRLSCVKS